MPDARPFADRSTPTGPFGPSAPAVATGATGPTAATVAAVAAVAARARRRWLLAGSAAATLATTANLAGCALLPPPNLRPPEVGLADLMLTDIALDRLKFQVGLDTLNPNDVSLPLTDIRVDFSLFDVALAQGYVLERRIEIPAGGRIRVPVEFNVPTSRLLDVIERFRSRRIEELAYRLSGQATWGDGPFSVPFERQGSLDILKRLGAIFGTS